MENKKRKLLVPTIFTLLVFVIFFFMTYKTPLAGDDWGYALNGMKGKPILTAFSFYKTWSGRFFSELWGFIVAPNKWLWNILNPLLFASMFLYMFIISNKKENGIVTALLIFTMMLNVSSQIRMETYTWIMGSTYVVPLALSLLYFVIIFKNFDDLKKMPLVLKICTVIICFYIGLTMENIAAIVVFSELLLIIYYYIKNKKIPLILIVNMIISLISFIIMRLSPGSTYRLIRDHSDFNNLSLTEKIIINLPYFINYSFIEHKLTIAFFASSLIGLSFFKEKNKLLKYAFIIYQLISLGLLFSLNIGSILHNDFISNLNNQNSVLIWLYWLIYIVVAFIIIIRNIENEKDRLKVLFFITIGGSCNIVMLLSPIFGARSSLYFVYFVIVSTALIYQEFIVKEKVWMIIVILIWVALSGLRVKEYYYKYNLVEQVNNERQQIIEYYRTHPEEKDIYLPRMPIYSIHSGDIEEGDDYHFETFKAYYGLNEDTNIIFYWKEAY